MSDWCEKCARPLPDAEVIESLRQRVAAQDELLREMGEALEKIDAEYMTLPQYACESIAKYREMRK